MTGIKSRSLFELTLIGVVILLCIALLFEILSVKVILVFGLLIVLPGIAYLMWTASKTNQQEVHVEPVDQVKEIPVSSENEVISF